MLLVASAEGGDQVAACDFRQRSESDARMLMHTVRSSGCCMLLVLKVLASFRCCSLAEGSLLPTTMVVLCWPAAVITSAGIVSVFWSWVLRSRGSVRTDIDVVVERDGSSQIFLLLALHLGLMIFTVRAMRLGATKKNKCVWNVVHWYDLLGCARLR